MNRLFFRSALMLCLALFGLAVQGFAALGGTYTVGPGRDYATISEALDALTSEGLLGDVKIVVTPGTYAGPLLIHHYPGSELHQLSILTSVPGSIIIDSADPTAPAISIDGASKVDLDGFSVTSAASSQPAVRISNGSDNVRISHSDLKGRATGRILEVTGPETGNIIVENCSIRRGGDGIYFDGQSGSASGNLVRDCVIDSVLQGIYINRQTNFLVEDCQIHPNANGGNGATAIGIGVQSAGDSVRILRNRLTQIRTSSGYASAIRHNPLTSAAYLFAADNFIYDFQNTGSSQVRALNISGGQNRIVNNSILVNDVTATGTAYAIYNGLIAPDARLTLLNNIIANREATRPAYGLFNLTPAAALESNHNLFYGTGSSYQLGWLIQAYANLALWKAGSGQDTGSLEGNPLFVSDADLHLQATSELPHQNGAVALDVTKDIDRQSRFQPPDIGADEYAFLAPPHDAAILNVLGIPSSFPAYSLLRLEVVVQNRGSQALLSIPLRLSYDDTARAEVLVSLPPSAADTFLLLWSTGAVHPVAELLVEIIQSNDANPQNNMRPFDLAVTGQPMAGTFSVGGAGADFSSLTEVAAALSQRGVNASVTLELATGIYAENFTLESVAGLTAATPLHIRQSPGTEGLVIISPASPEPAVRLANVSFVTLEDLIIQGNGNALIGMEISAGTHHVTIRDCQLACASVTQSSAAAVSVGADCYENTLERLQVHSAFTGLRLDGNSAVGDFGNVIRDCSIYDVRTAVFAAWQRSLIITGCNISAGFADAPSPCYGIRVGSLRPDDSVYVQNNRVMNHSSSGSLTAISCEAGNGDVLAVNNWIGGFSQGIPGAVTAIAIESGTAHVFHNSICIGDVASNHAVGVSISGAQTFAHLLNNIVKVEDPDASARFLEWSSGTVESNANLYDAPGLNTNFRFGHSSLDGDYQTLAEWVAATFQDSLSVSSQSGFVSADDLHLRPDALGPADRGIFIPSAATDIDGEPRQDIPDVGADEFQFLSAIVDLAVEMIEVPVIPMVAGTQYQILTTLRNAGELPITNATAVLYYNGVPVTPRLVSLTPGQQLEMYWDWTAPQTDLAYGTLSIAVFADSDAVAANNSASHAVVVAGAPLTDSVVVGMSSTGFGTLDELQQHLKWRGIGTALDVLLLPGIHEGPLSLTAIPGADSLRRVTIRPQTAETTTITASNAPAVVMFSDAHNITIQDLGLESTNGTPVVIALDALSCDNVISGCYIVGGGSGSLETYGVLVSGAACHGNRIEGNTVSTCYVGIALTGDEAQLSRDNVVTRNKIDNVFYGVWVDHQVNALVSQNNITPGSQSGPAGACYGVYVVQLGESGTARVERNSIHDFLDSGGPRTNRAAGVYSAPGISSTVEIVNNFIFGFSELTTLRIRGIYLSSGNHLVANNSIRLDDASADNETAGIYISTGSQHEIFNNCVMSYENDIAATGLDIETGANAMSDYNCFWGNASNFLYAAFGSQNYSSLTSWQATGRDALSRQQHVRYVSPADLHVQNTDTVMHARGLSLPQVSGDFDGDLRNSPPCMGADEYELQNNLAAPASLCICPAETGEIMLFWDSVPGAIRYRVYAAATPDLLQTSPVEIGSSTSTTYAWDPALDNSPTLFFIVRAE